MNRFAYLTTGYAVKLLSDISRARIKIHGQEHIPADGANIFVINHFTRMETVFIPYWIHKITGIPVWSLADYGLFQGFLGNWLDKVGAVSTKDVHRDRLIVKTLLTGEASWIIFPEGRMVKNKKIIEKGRFMISYAGGKHPPHTGAATLGLRTEFYRRRLHHLAQNTPEQAQALKTQFGIDPDQAITEKQVCIVPVNLTYYPIRARENVLSKLAAMYVEEAPERMMEEIMTEGTMLLSGVDVDIRFGEPIPMANYVQRSTIKKDITRPGPIGFDDPIPSKRLMRKLALQIMQRYMSAIYCMTTVNHDHLFASLLKLYPYRIVDPESLKRRVFLAATVALKASGAHRHSSLNYCQVHLLTDDRFGKYSEFMDLAMEKGIVKPHGDRLIKDKSLFYRTFDFHQVRVDNPIAVIANEVEPLCLLQKKLHRIAWMPEFMVRKRIVNVLKHQAIREFDRDYEKFFIAGESKPKYIGRPFLLEGTSRKTGILLAHGYMAAPEEVRELAEFLAKQGYWVYVPRLRGHGTSADDLATRTFEDWALSLESGYVLLSQICKNVIVGGFSTGAALALNLATRVDGIKAVFAICPPLRLQDVKARFASAVDAWNRLMKKVRLDSVKRDFIENHPENPDINYPRNPISGVKEIELLVEALEPRLPNLTLPTLIAQSHKDPVVNPRGSRRLFELLGSPHKEYLLVNFNRHCIVRGKNSQRVHRAVADFIDFFC